MLNRYINYLMFIFIFVFPISIALTNILFAILILLWLLEGNYKEKFNILIKDKIFIAFMVLILILFISTFFSDSIYHGYLSKGRSEYVTILKRLFYPLFLYMIFITSVKKENIEKLLDTFLLSMFFSEIVSYSIYFHLINIEYFKHLGLLSKFVAYNDPSPFMIHIWYSLFLAIAILILIDKLFTIKSYKLKIFIMLFITSATLNLFINGGRTGQLAFVIGFISYFALKYKKSFKYISISFVTLILIVFLAYKYSPIFNSRVKLAVENLENVKKGNYRTSWGHRIAADILSYNYLTKDIKSFLFGMGAGDAKKKFRAFAKNYPKLTYSANYLYHLHNQYLQFWIEGGFFAFLTFIFILGFMIYKYKYPLVVAIYLMFALSFISDVLIYWEKTFLLFLFLTAYFVKKYEV